LKKPLIAIATLAIAVVGCGQSDAGTRRSSGGAGGANMHLGLSGGSKSGGTGGMTPISGLGGSMPSAGTSTVAGGSGGGTLAQGGAGGRTDLAGGTSGHAGSAGDPLGAGRAGTSGAGSSAGGNASGGGGQTGESVAGDTGAGGDDGGLAVGQYEFDLTVTYQGRSAHFTHCQEQSGQLTMVEGDGYRRASVSCEPDFGAAFQVDLVNFAFYSGAVGEHDVSAFPSTCDPVTASCDLIQVAVSFEPVIGQGVYVDTTRATAKSGVVKIDEFTVDGRVSGTVDLTMTQSGYEVSVTGRFAAHVNDCGSAATAGDSSCLGPHN